MQQDGVLWPVFISESLKTKLDNRTASLFAVSYDRVNSVRAFHVLGQRSRMLVQRMLVRDRTAVTQSMILL